MPRTWVTLSALLAAACADGAVPQAAPVPRGSRVLSLDVRPAEDGNYDAAFTLAHSIGVEAVTLAIDWSTAEPTAGQFNLTNPDIANVYYPAHGAGVALSVRPVSTTYRSLPADLAARPLGDSAVIGRFNALLDSLHAHLGAVNLTGLYIGAEHDAYFGTDSAAWADWQRFFDAVRPHARALWRTVPVGTEFTFQGLTGPAAGYTQAANRGTDVVVVSYYPIDARFQVLPPSAVGAAFSELAAAYPGRPIHVNQLGYPSSGANGSSPEMQREFVAQAFAAWDAHAAQVTVLNFNWQTDLSQAAVDGFQDLYGLHDRSFAEFLRTLGFRTFGGTGSDKPAWAELERQAALRGW